MTFGELRAQELILQDIIHKIINEDVQPSDILKYCFTRQNILIKKQEDALAELDGIYADVINKFER